MENNFKKIILDNYGIEIIDFEVLSGGWMNKKYLVTSRDNKKYVIKFFSSEKVKKMSKGEFSTNYLDNQLANNLKIENYMNDNGLYCEKIFLTHDNKILFSYEEDRLAVIEYLNGKYISRDDISIEQLYNLGNECAKMHLLFRNVNSSQYVGEYLKLPSIERLFVNYEKKSEDKKEPVKQEYLDLLLKQKECLINLKEHDIYINIPISLTHGDFADDNIIFYGDIPYILDFELVRINSPLLDIGRIIMSYSFNNGSLNYEKRNSFLSGYNKTLKLQERDILLSLVVVWINEVDMWIKKNYFNKTITEKAKRFQDELVYLTYNLSDIIKHYENNGDLKDFCNVENFQMRLSK